jgi:hypothetical protein
VLALVIVSIGVRALGYLGLTWLVADTVRRAWRQAAGGGSRRAVVGGVIAVVGTLAGAAAFVANIARESGALDGLLTLR